MAAGRALVAALVLIVVAGAIIVVDPARGQPLVELARVVTWPLVVSVALLGGGAPLRNAVVALIGRLEKAAVKGFGVEANIEAEHQRQESSATALAEASERVQQAAEVKFLPEDEASLSAIDLTQLAMVNANQWRFEFLAHYLVESTQLVLNWFAQNGVTPIAQYHDAWSGLIPDRVERDKILNVLLEQKLVTAQPRPSGPDVFVTELGKAFLGYIAEKRKSGYTPPGASPI